MGIAPAGQLRIGSQAQETDVATLYLHPDGDPGSKGKLLGTVTPRAVAEEIGRRWNSGAPPSTLESRLPSRRVGV